MVKSMIKQFGCAILATVLALVFFSCQTANARGEEDGIPGFTKTLNARQQATLKKIWSENAAARKELRKALAAKRGELAGQMKSETPDKAKIESLSREIGELRGKMLVEGAQTHARVAKAGLPVGEMKFRDRGGKYDKNNLAPRLNPKLSAEQKTAGQKILAANAAARDKINESIIAKRGELAEIMKNPDPDAAKIESLSAEIGSLRGQLLVDRIELRQQLKKAGLPGNCLEPGAPAQKMSKRAKKAEKVNKDAAQ